LSVFTIDGQLFREMIMNAASMLEKNRTNIDALNVFPVPDGDTGTNMSLTMMLAAKDVSQSQSKSIAQVAEIVSKGSLKGARGNSGVILSQLMRGFAKGAAGKDELTPEDFAHCLKEGSDTAYRAMMKPREGTILTVARVIADELLKRKSFSDFETLFSDIMSIGENILRKTPDMLPVLKQAGVVDAGGKGLLTMYSGYAMAINGTEIELDPSFDMVPQMDVSFIGETEHESIEFGYCTEFFIRNMTGNVDSKAERLRERLNEIGDCVLVVGDSDLLKVHVHSDHPGQALEFALEVGSLHGLKIDNMREQHNTIIEEAKGVNQAPRGEYACIAVAAGEGVANVFRDLGAGEIIQGGQTMNPSTEAFLNAIEKANAKTVYILPNNSNIVLAAQQAGEMTESCDVKVVPTKTIPQGIAAMLSFMPENEAEDNFAAMCKSVDSIKSGRITYAVRDSQIDDKEIKEGDIMGMSDSGLVALGSDINSVFMETIDSMIDEDSGVITVFYGEEVDEETAGSLLEDIENAYPDCDVEMLSGGQPVYYYILSVE
jgi:DAK2 domain fusion protein YloV